jgi:hypothetical protein
MTGVARNFFASAIIYGLAGMCLGLYMGLIGNHTELPTHAHIMLIGWLSFAVFGMFYASFKEAGAGLLAKVHFWLAQIGFLGLAAGLAFIYAGRSEFEPVAGIFSIIYFLSFLLFAWIALPAVAGSAQRA